MTPERLEQIEEHDSPLTANELALGWHFCTSFDGMLTSGEPTNRDTPEGLLTCACGNKINPNTCITHEGEEPHGTRDTFVPPPIKSHADLILEFGAAQDKLTDQALTATNNTMMTPSRWLQLTMNSSYGHLTPLERQEGWHYCPRLDDQLTKMQDNQCKLCDAEKLDKFGFPVRTFEQQLADLKESIDPDPLSLVVYDPNEPVPHLTDEQLTAALIKGKAEADAMDSNLIQEMQIALDSIKEEDLKPYDRPVPPIPSPQDKTIHYHNKRWWFWDETGMHRHGPYETHAECVKDFNHYCNVYLGEPEDPS